MSVWARREITSTNIKVHDQCILIYYEIKGGSCASEWNDLQQSNKGGCNGKTTVSVLHDAQLLLIKQPQIWGLTGQLADKPTRRQSSRGLDNSRTSRLADSEFLKIMKLLYFICSLNLTLTITVTLLNIDSI